jgi:cysteine desulfurase
VQRVYLDNNATTRLAPEALEAMLPFLGELFANPSSPYPGAQSIANAVRAARGEVARLVGARSAREVVFTSGGTESINAAFYAALRAQPTRPRVVVSTVEHSAARACADRVEATGREVVRVPVDAQGQLDRERLFATVDADTALVSLLWANNETGVLTDLSGIGAACRAAGAHFHLDAVQAPGKVPLDVEAVEVDLLSLSAHKFHGPKGIGALYVRSGLPFAPLVAGGPQEDERRAGTENVPGIVGMGVAARLAGAHARDVAGLARLAAQRDSLEAALVAASPGARANGAGAARVASTTNITFPGRDAQALLALLGEAGVEASAGSACNARKVAPSPVLLAMGQSPEDASAALRFSLSRNTTAAEVARAVAAVQEALALLGALG